MHTFQSAFWVSFSGDPCTSVHIQWQSELITLTDETKRNVFRVEVGARHTRALARPQEQSLWPHADGKGNYTARQSSGVRFGSFISMFERSESAWDWLNLAALNNPSFSAVPPASPNSIVRFHVQKSQPVAPSQGCRLTSTCTPLAPPVRYKAGYVALACAFTFDLAAWLGPPGLCTRSYLHDCHLWNDRLRCIDWNCERCTRLALLSVNRHAHCTATRLTCWVYEWNNAFLSAMYCMYSTVSYQFFS